MLLTAMLAPELPYLRRYARALTGSQTLGDAAVREMLEALLEAPDEFDTDERPRVELYRIFHRLWHGISAIGGMPGLVAGLSLRARQALLLTSVEGFSETETGIIINCAPADVTAAIVSARKAITDSLQGNVLIIEDESIIALHIKLIVESLGHNVVGIARTRADAVALAQQARPELVLADISLADGSSGIDAVKDILEVMDVPVIFITAFPERLLTGERPEPTYLITKPFEPETVTATIGQAMLVHREQHADGRSAPDPKRHFAMPAAVLLADDLDDTEKRALLVDWEADLDRQLDAESEGMGASDPMSARREANLADEVRQVKTALTRLPPRADTH